MNKNQPKKKNDSDGIANQNERSIDQINIGNVSNNVGVAIGRGAQAIVTQISGGATDEITLAFKSLHLKVSALPNGPDKEMAQSVVKTLETEARKGENASEGQVKKWINFLAATAPDAFEVAIDTFSNPVKGVGTIFKKIAEKIKSEQASIKPK
jgi:hypothetical protein